MVGKYTLIFDANFWLHKTYFIGQKIKQGKPFNFFEKSQMTDYLQFGAKSLSDIVNLGVDQAQNLNNGNA